MSGEVGVRQWLRDVGDGKGQVKRQALKLNVTVRIPTFLMLLPFAAVRGGPLLPVQSVEAGGEQNTDFWSCVNQDTLPRMTIGKVKQTAFKAGGSSHY